MAMNRMLFRCSWQSHHYKRIIQSVILDMIHFATIILTGLYQSRYHKRTWILLLEQSFLCSTPCYNCLPSSIALVTIYQLKDPTLYPLNCLPRSTACLMYALDWSCSGSILSRAVWKSDKRFCDNKRNKLRAINGNIWGELGRTDLHKETLTSLNTILDFLGMTYAKSW